MPVYRNETDRTITHNAETWGPGQTKPVPFFVPSDSGLTLLSEKPRVANQALASGIKTLSAGESFRLYIPECQTFVASIIVNSGSVLVAENYADNEVQTPVGEGCVYRSTMFRNYVEALLISNPSSDSDAEIVYHVSKYYREC